MSSSPVPSGGGHRADVRGGPLLEVDHVVVQFGGVTAVNEACFTADPGTVTGLIGPNGAGKTTCFNVISGLQKPTRGKVRFQGKDVTSMPVHRRSKRGMGRTFQRLEAFGSLSVRDNVRVAADIHRGALAGLLPGGGHGKNIDALLERVGIAAYAQERADSIPTGTARLLELARCLAGDPKLLLLDEPSSGLDETETDAFGELLRDLAAEGRAILMVLDHRLRRPGGDSSRPRRPEGLPRLFRRGRRRGRAHQDRPAGCDRRHTRHPGGPGRSRGMSGVPILEVVDLHAAYGRIEVLRGVDLVVPKGAVMALLGPNGAGKSTLVKVISGQKKPTSGDIHLGGVHVKASGPEELARLGLCTIPEGRSVFPNLTVEENLLLMSYAGVPAEAVLETAFAYFPRLKERRKQFAGTMSGGEQQMVAMSRALASDPALLLLDELSMGLAPLIVDELYETVGRITETGVSILCIEQFARTALKISDYAAVMSGGRVVATGEPGEILETMSDVILGGAA